MAIIRNTFLELEESKHHYKLSAHRTRTLSNAQYQSACSISDEMDFILTRNYGRILP